MENYHTLPSWDRVAYRKKKEICQKTTALRAELDFWKDRSKNEDAPLKKHHTQIQAIDAHLEQWHQIIVLNVKQSLRETGAKFFESIQNAERLMLSEHRIWEYFRVKLAQRNDENFKDYLAVADEFAWACYQLVQRTVYSDPVNAARKEPPLVFFNGGTSPFSVSRGKSYEAEAVPGERLSSKDAGIINQLPIPVVGVPWTQIKHLPDAVVIGHEVGHIVEDDFQLTERLGELFSEALKEAPKGEERRKAWGDWQGEIFADVYGCLAAGPAFAGALIDFLARDFQSVSTETRQAGDWGDYPTTYLRIKIVLETLTRLGFDHELDDYRTVWETFTSSMAPGFTSDIPFIVDKLLHSKLIKSDGADVEDKSLVSIFAFARKEQNQVDKTLENLRLNVGLVSQNVRVLLATARMAFEKGPEEYENRDYGATLLQRCVASIEPDIRRDQPRLTEEQIKIRLKAYKHSAAAMVETLTRSD